MNTCINCEHPLDGLYCGACGQKQPTQRFTTRQIFQDLLSSITNVERGLWHTIIMLFAHPHQVLKDYLAGKTRPYFNPVRYLILFAGLGALVALSFGFFEAQTESMNNLMGTNDNPDALAAQQRAMAIGKKMMHIVPLLMIPFLSIVSRRIFRPSNLNYAEHLIINTFLMGQLALLGIFIQFFYIFRPELISWGIPVSLTLGIVYYTYALKPTFGLSYVHTFFRSTAVYIGGYLLFILSIAVLALITGLTVGFLKAAGG